MPQSTQTFDFPFSGREKERALLEKTLESALSENGSITFILGESGIGKTRLAQNILEIAREKGFTCTLAKCPKGGSLLPYSVWTECLRKLADDM
ncbi:MAG: BREX system ATP-binding domain-containing protein, partial [Nitrososphaerales archaeon]